jgi:Sulfotransferase family
MERFRFLHIPKTAGSTFTSILYRQRFGKKRFVFTGDLPMDSKRFESMSAKDKEATLLFTGHAALLTGITEADTATTITFLRNPVDRVKSFCQHVFEGKSPYLKMTFSPKNFDLDEFLRSGNEELSNLQTKMLIRDPKFPSLPSLVGMSVSEAKNKALDSLFNWITLFGLAEYFDESLILFSSALNWKIPVYAPQNQMSRTKRIEFNQRHLNKILELNEIDIEVYKVAKDRFVKLLNDPEFDWEKLKRLQKFNRLVSNLAPGYDWSKVLLKSVAKRIRTGGKS